MKRPLHSRTIGLGFALACLVIGWIGMAIYWSTHQLVRSFDSVSESHQAIEKLQSIQELMESGTASAYSYVITGREERLTTYRHTRTLIARKQHEVELLLKGHPKQKKALRQFRQLFSIHQEYLANIIEVRQGKGYEAAAQWVSAEDDQSIREGLSDLLDAVQHEENQVLKERSASTTEHSSKTNVALFGAAGASLFVIMAVFLLLRLETGGRREAENTNVQLETFLRSIVERIPYMVLVKDATNLRITLANKAATEWLGHTEQELIGSNDYDLRPRATADLAIEQDRDVLKNGVPVDIAEESLVRDGKEDRILHTQKVAIPDENGAPAFLLTISEDITQRKQAERMLELSRDAAVQSERLKSEFIRNMSHEIRTPLSIVIGMISILMDSELNHEQRSIAAKIERSANNLGKLTKGILDFSKIEAGTFTLEMQEMNLRQTLEGISTMLTEEAKAKGVGMVSLIPPTIPPIVVGDPNRLRQVLTELVTNALKFTPRGEVIVRVTEAEQTENQLWLTFKVSDTGVGISEEAQQHIFEPFRQGDGSPTRKYGGTGLGLAISKRIVELMGGKIGYTSALNQGSTFWCTIPFTKRGMQGQPSKSATAPWTRARVLVVDENEISRQRMRDQLSSWTLANEGVSSGATALALLRREEKAGRPFQIVLFDMHLADMEGVAFARAVKAEPALSGTQLLVLAENALDSGSADSLGFTAWVSKPVNNETLYQRLASLIETQDHARPSAA